MSYGLCGKKPFVVVVDVGSIQTPCRAQSSLFIAFSMFASPYCLLVCLPRYERPVDGIEFFSAGWIISDYEQICSHLLRPVENQQLHPHSPSPRSYNMSDRHSARSGRSSGGSHSSGGALLPSSGGVQQGGSSPTRRGNIDNDELPQHTPGSPGLEMLRALSRITEEQPSRARGQSSAPSPSEVSSIAGGSSGVGNRWLGRSMEAAAPDASGEDWSVLAGTRGVSPVGTEPPGSPVRRPSPVPVLNAAPPMALNSAGDFEGGGYFSGRGSGSGVDGGYYSGAAARGERTQARERTSSPGVYGFVLEEESGNHASTTANQFLRAPDYLTSQVFLQPTNFGDDFAADVVQQQWSHAATEVDNHVSANFASAPPMDSADEGEFDDNFATAPPPPFEADEDPIRGATAPPAWSEDEEQYDSLQAPDPQAMNRHVAFRTPIRSPSIGPIPPLAAVASPTNLEDSWRQSPPLHQQRTSEQTIFPAFPEDGLVASPGPRVISANQYAVLPADHTGPPDAIPVTVDSVVANPAVIPPPQEELEPPVLAGVLYPPEQRERLSYQSEAPRGSQHSVVQQALMVGYPRIGTDAYGRSFIVDAPSSESVLFPADGDKQTSSIRTAPTWEGGGRPELSTMSVGELDRRALTENDKSLLGSGRPRGGAFEDAPVGDGDEGDLNGSWKRSGGGGDPKKKTSFGHSSQRPAPYRSPLPRIADGSGEPNGSGERVVEGSEEEVSKGGDEHKRSRSEQTQSVVEQPPTLELLGGPPPKRRKTDQSEGGEGQSDRGQQRTISSGGGDIVEEPPMIDDTPSNDSVFRVEQQPAFEKAFTGGLLAEAVLRDGTPVGKSGGVVTPPTAAASPEGGPASPDHDGRTQSPQRSLVAPAMTTATTALTGGGPTSAATTIEVPPGTSPASPTLAGLRGLGADSASSMQVEPTEPTSSVFFHTSTLDSAGAARMDSLRTKTSVDSGGSRRGPISEKRKMAEEFLRQKRLATMAKAAAGGAGGPPPPGVRTSRAAEQNSSAVSGVAPPGADQKFLEQQQEKGDEETPPALPKHTSDVVVIDGADIYEGAEQPPPKPLLPPPPPAGPMLGGMGGGMGGMGMGGAGGRAPGGNLGMGGMGGLGGPPPRQHNIMGTYFQGLGGSPPGGGVPVPPTGIYQSEDEPASDQSEDDQEAPGGGGPQQGVRRLGSPIRPAEEMDIDPHNTTLFDILIHKRNREKKNMEKLRGVNNRGNINNLGPSATPGGAASGVTDGTATDNGDGHGGSSGTGSGSEDQNVENTAHFVPRTETEMIESAVLNSMNNLFHRPAAYNDSGFDSYDYIPDQPMEMQPMTNFLPTHPFRGGGADRGRARDPSMAVLIEDQIYFAPGRSTEQEQPTAPTATVGGPGMADEAPYVGTGRTGRYYQSKSFPKGFQTCPRMLTIVCPCHYKIHTVS